MTVSFYWQMLVHATEYHLQKKIANVIYAGILKQDDWIEITAVSHASRASFDLPEWGAKRWLCLNHVKPLRWPQPKLLDQSILFSLFKLFVWACIRLFEFIDKPMVMTKTAVASARLLGLGSKLYPSDMLRMFNKDLSQFMQSLSKYAKIRQA